MCRAWAGTLLVTAVSLILFPSGCGTSQSGPTAAVRQSDITVEDARQALLELLDKSQNTVLKMSYDHLRTVKPVQESAELVSFGKWNVNLRAKTFNVAVVAGTGQIPIFEQDQGHFERTAGRWAAVIDSVDRN